MTKLTYRIFPPSTKTDVSDPILQINSNVTMADYRFRVNAEQLGIDPMTIATRMQWGDDECRFEIEADAPAATLSAAFADAVRSTGLYAERCMDVA